MRFRPSVQNLDGDGSMYQAQSVRKALLADVHAWYGTWGMCVPAYAMNK